MTMMKFEEFEEYVKQNLKILLPENYEDASIKIDEVKKPGYSYHGMAVTQQNQRFGVIVDLDHYYSMYRKPVPISQIMFSIASLVQESFPDVDLELIMDYEWVKNRLFIRVFNRNWSKDYLRHIPHQVVEDLAITPHILVASDGKQISSTPVTYDLLREYGIPPQELFDTAMQNGMKMFPPTIKYMADLLGIGRDIRAERVITNEWGINGAAALFYPGEMDEISEEISDDFYAVPTSVHEMILIPAGSAMSEGKMNEALHQTIRDYTDEREWLSDHIYYYDSEHHVFSSVKTMPAGKQFS